MGRKKSNRFDLSERIDHPAPGQTALAGQEWARMSGTGLSAHQDPYLDAIQRRLWAGGQSPDAWSPALPRPPVARPKAAELADRIGRAAHASGASKKPPLQPGKPSGRSLSLEQMIERGYFDSSIPMPPAGQDPRHPLDAIFAPEYFQNPNGRWR